MFLPPVMSLTSKRQAQQGRWGTHHLKNLCTKHWEIRSRRWCPCQMSTTRIHWPRIIWRKKSSRGVQRMLYREWNGFGSFKSAPLFCPFGMPVYMWGKKMAFWCATSYGNRKSCLLLINGIKWGIRFFSEQKQWHRYNERLLQLNRDEKEGLGTFLRAQELH